LLQKLRVKNNIYKLINNFSGKIKPVKKIILLLSSGDGGGGCFLLSFPHKGLWHDGWMNPFGVMGYLNCLIILLK